MAFTQDLKEGIAVEEEFVEFLTSFKIKAGRNTATSLTEKRFYDVFNFDGQTFEIKYDRRAEETNNVYLEHEALNHSRADYIVYKLKGDKNFYILDRATVLTLLGAPLYKTVNGGDKWGEGTLIPLTAFRKIFKDFGKEIKKKTPRKKT